MMPQLNTLITFRVENQLPWYDLKFQNREYEVYKLTP